MQELPIGISDYRELVEYKNPISKEGYLYIDKSLFIKEIIADSGTKVIVLTRPRRFGKTINLSMLQHFFAAEVNGRSTTGLFDNLEISKHLECMQLQGKHPVIFLTLKDAKADNVDSATNRLYEQIRQVYEQHRYVIEDNKISKEEKEAFISILNKTANLDDLSFSLYNLSYYIHKTLGQTVYILIDEYDTPIQASYINGYYNEFISFMRGLLGSALKGNANIRQAILTGILRVSKESLFSDLNNVEIYSVLNKKYSNCFGFTEGEVNNLLIKAKLPLKTKQTKEWYNGYNFAGATIYNPLSIVKFIKEEGILKPYWVNTSGNDLIKQLIINSEPEIKDKIATLIAGESIKEMVDEHIVFGDLDTNPSALWNLFLMSGYLKAVSTNTDENEEDNEEYELSIPNKEIDSLYRKIVREWLSGARGLNWYREFLNDLVTGKVAAFESKLQTLIGETVSFHDATKNSQEVFYHGLMLGVVAGLRETHIVRSNQESGDGRYDVAIIPKDIKQLGIIIEFKAPKQTKKKEINLEKKAKVALEQAKQCNYIAELKQQGISKICLMGIAFFKKDLRIAAEEYPKPAIS